jgi:hypothetical protein
MKSIEMKLHKWNSYESQIQRETEKISKRLNIPSADHIKNSMMHENGAL